MSTSKKKTKKLRQANYAAAGLAGAPTEARGGAEAYPQPVSRFTTHPDFDYTHIRRDLRRIGLLAGLCVSALVVLSFFIR